MRVVYYHDTRRCACHTGDDLRKIADDYSILLQLLAIVYTGRMN